MMTPKSAVSPMETFRRMRRTVEKNSANDLILGVGDACHRPNPTHQLQDSLVSSKQIEDGHHDCPLRAFTTSRSVLFVARVIAVSPLGVGCLHICPCLHEHLDSLRSAFTRARGTPAFAAILGTRSRPTPAHSVMDQTHHLSPMPQRAPPAMDSFYRWTSRDSHIIQRVTTTLRK